MSFPRASRALERFTVLDLTRVRAGPTCVRQLADWGANVIKIELPPDPHAGDPLGGPRESSDFQNLHRNKRSITLNLKAPEALAAFKRMVKKADVVVENFRPDVKRRLGIDYKQIARINPKLIYASISGFGQTGPYANRPGFDQIAQGMGGLMSITGLPGQGPVRVGIPIADIERYTVKRTSAEWIDLLNKAGVPCGSINSIDQVYADPQVLHLAMAQPVKTKGKPLRMARQPMRLSRTPSRLVAPPPGLGEHTNTVLKEFGLSAKEISALRKANAI